MSYDDFFELVLEKLDAGTITPDQITGELATLAKEKIILNQIANKEINILRAVVTGAGLPYDEETLKGISIVYWGNSKTFYFKQGTKDEIRLCSMSRRFDDSRQALVIDMQSKFI